MSDIHNCGFCDVLASLVRRVLCAGTATRRGSSETGYRELGDRGLDSPSLHHQRLRDRSQSYSEFDDHPLDDVMRLTYKEELELIFEDPAPHTMKLFQKHQLGDFHSMKRNKSRVRSINSRAEVGLETTYPKQLELLLANTVKWSFDTHDLDKATAGRCLPELGMHLFASYGLIKFFKLSPENCWKLFCLIEQHYHDSNPYHNAVHAADVTQAIHCFLQQKPLLNSMQPLEIMVVLLAAICHDLDHPGVNHSFLVATEHPLAVIFKDNNLGAKDRSPMLLRRGRKGRKLREQMRDLASARASPLPFTRLEAPSQSTSQSSVESETVYEETECKSILEHHHWRMAYGCVLESGIFSHMPEHLPAIKRMLRSLILATDITRQNDYLNQFKRLLSRKTLDTRRADHRHMILQMAIKAADISNPGRPWFISQKWSTKVCSEFYRQGDQEAERHLEISSLCNRVTDTVPKIQTGFFRNIVAPLYTEWNSFLKSHLSRDMLKNLSLNEAKWSGEDHRSASRTATERSTSDTLTKISDADQVEYDLETSLNISGSSEMLVASGSETSGMRSRRQSHSPKSQGSMIDVIRRYSAPLHLFSESRSGSRSLKRDSIPERAESPAPAPVTSTPACPIPTSSKIVDVVALYNATPFKVECYLGSSTSSELSSNGNSLQIQNTLITNMTSSESRLYLPLEADKTNDATTAVAAAGLCPLQRLASLTVLTGRAHAASCQRLSVENLCNARRGSLPIEAMRGACSIQDVSQQCHMKGKYLKYCR